MARLISLFFTITCVCFSACVDQVGKKGQSCTSKGFCSTGLVCRDGVCVDDREVTTGTVEGYVYLEDRTDHKDIAVSIDGLEEFKNLTDSSGYYIFTTVPPGSYSVTASMEGYGDRTSDLFHVRAEQTSTVPSMTLNRAKGSIEGYVFLVGKTIHSGTIVSLTDTSYTAITNGEGYWYVNEVRSGLYTVLARHDGYADGMQTNQEVVSGQMTTVPVITLYPPQCTIENAAEICGSSPCVDGYCCNRVCDGICETCNGNNTTSPAGICGDIVQGEDPDDECTDIGSCISSCNGSGECRVNNGAGSEVECLAQGNNCISNDQCATSYCADGFCCDLPCEGVCETCNGVATSSNPGTCGNILRGEDPEIECPDLGSCVAACNGLGACRVNYGSGIEEQCLPQGDACTSNVQCATLHCKDGHCCDTSCDNPCYNCVTGTCQLVTNIDDPPECTSSNTCDLNGNCLKKTGEICIQNNECASWFCVDGYCCNDRCDGPCEACHGNSTNQSVGTCGYIILGEDIEDECPDLGSCISSCNGSGSCRVNDGSGSQERCEPRGSPCLSSVQCSTGFCVDFYCCDSSCDGVCETCDGIATAVGSGTCGFILAEEDTSDECAQQDPSTCGTTGSCDGLGHCQFYDSLTSCEDGLYCNGQDFCDANGGCTVHLGDPCLTGSECNDTCNETDDNCYALSGTTCTDLTILDCLDARCDGLGLCDQGHSFELSGYNCGDQSVECLVDDACNDFGVCVDSGFEPFGTPCFGGWCDSGNCGPYFQSIGPDVGDIQSLSLSSTFFYAVADGQYTKNLFRYSIGGGIWSLIKSNFEIYRLYSSPDGTLLIALQRRPWPEYCRMIRSLDYGNTWEDLNVPFDVDCSDSYRKQIAINQSNPSIIYYHNRNEFDPILARSDDGGDTWTIVNLPVPDRYVYSMSVDPNSSQRLAIILYTSAGSGQYSFWISHDRGSSWTEITNLPSDSTYSHRFDFWEGHNGRIVYSRSVADPLYTIYITNDFGNTWNFIDYGYNDSFYILELLPVPNTEYLFIWIDSANPDSADYHLLRGDLTTGAFTSLEDSRFIWPIHDMSYINSTLVAGLRSGVFKSFDFGSTWIEDNVGLRATKIVSLVVDPYDQDTFYLSSRSGLFKYSESSGTFTKITNDLLQVMQIDSYIKLFPNPYLQNRIMAGASWNGIWNSQDGGNSWTQSISGIVFPYSAVFAPGPQSQVLFADGFYNDGLWYSNNDGMSFGSRNSTAPSEWTFIELENSLSDPQVVYAVVIEDDTTYDGYIYVSNDFGINWSVCGSGLPYGSIGWHAMKQILFSPDDSPGTVYVFENNNVYISSDYCSTWNVTTESPSGSDVSSIILAEGFFMTGMYDGDWAIYKGVDSGQHWSEYGHGLDINYVNGMSYNSNSGYLYAGTLGLGVFRIQLIP